MRRRMWKENNLAKYIEARAREIRNVGCGCRKSRSIPGCCQTRAALLVVVVVVVVVVVAVADFVELLAVAVYEIPFGGKEGNRGMASLCGVCK